MNATKGPEIDIIMTTYNQSLYLEQAIESVLNQKCNFYFQLIIGDDCSADDSYKIVCDFKKRYPDVILAYQNEFNMGLAANYQKAFSLSKAKYIAILEGDDFYTDPYKLQKQFDILEASDTYGLVHSNYSVLRSDGTTAIGHGFKSEKKLHGDLFQVLLSNNCICPATVLMRAYLVKQYVNFNYAVANFFKTIDLFLWLEISSHKRVYYQNEITSCYRILQNSVSNSLNLEKVKDFVQTTVKIVEYYIKEKSITDSRKRLIVGNAYYPLIVLMLKMKIYNEAKKLSSQLYLGSMKQLWIWIVANNKRLHFLFNFQIFMLQTGSKLKQTALKIITDNNG